MKEFRGIYFPDDETHLVDWMQRDGTMRDGKGTYQYRKYQAALALLPPERRRVAVDVGANVGLWSRVMALDFDMLDAFEPMLSYAACWEATMAGVLNAQLHPLALGAAPGWVTMEQCTPGSNGDTRVIPGSDDGDTARITLDSLDLRTLDLMKIDTEGYELMVLQGAEATLTRCKPVLIVEQKPGHASAFGLGDTDAIGWLEARGYRQAALINGDYIMVPG